jgi:hypothetical protein
MRLQTIAKNPAPTSTAQGFALQRKCACGEGSSSLVGECRECNDKETFVQRKSGSRYEAGGIAPPIINDVLRSSGQPLNAETRAMFEPRFGHDFSKVRIHSDHRAAEAAESVDAHAFTVGRDVVFGSAQYQPNTGTGQRLLAHELAHVIQQASGSVYESAGLKVSAPGDRFEQEADRVADSVTSGLDGRARREAAGPMRLSRKALGIQRTATWNSTGKVTAPFNLADRVLSQISAGNTDFVLNAVVFSSGKSWDDLRKSLKKPVIKHKSTNAGKECWFKSAAANKGSFEMKLLKAGAWEASASKISLDNLLGLPACAGKSGNAKFIVNGDKTNDEQRARTRTHEDQHVTDDEKIFNDVIGTWDGLITNAVNRKQTAASRDACEDQLYDALGQKQKPDDIMREVVNQVNTTGRNFHNSPAGRNVNISKQQSDPGCTTVTAEAS